MARLPAIPADGRGRDIARVAALAAGQAVAAAVAAFSTRDAFAALHADAAPPLAALALIAAAGLAIALLRVAERVAAEALGQRYAAALRLRLFSHLARMSERAVSARRAGALGLRFVGDLAAVRQWVSLGIARLVSAAVVLPAATLVLWLIEPTLAVAAAPPLALGLAAMALAGPRLGPAHRRLRARRARLAADMLERVPHAPELRLLGRIDVEVAHMMRRSQALIESARARASAAALLRAIPDLAGACAAAALLLAAFVADIPAPQAAGALAALGLMLPPMRDLADVWDRWRAWTVARDKCASVLDAPTLAPRGGRDAGAAPLGDTPPRLRLRGLTAGALAGTELQALPGQKIALVGANGAGKSSLLRIVAGLDSADGVQVWLGARAPHELTAAERRRLFALMSPRSPLLAGSLRRALTMGHAQRPSDAVIEQRAREFGLGAVLQRLGGLDGTLAEGGRNLSAGEARRVLLTRVALSGAQLLLLDEPDDALDADGAQLVAELVRDTRATVLVATHSLALARQLDCLWFVEHGRVVEAGAPHELLRAGGPAARHFRPRPAA
jgi:ABC-type multidrug transport system fused ATPase/permease subunit